MSTSRGFSLLEVLVALAILATAVVSLMQLSSQSLRLLKLSGDHQQAVVLADQLVRESAVRGEAVESGQKGSFTWERRVSSVPVPQDLTLPGSSVPQLLSVSVLVRWGTGQSVELATLRAVATPSSSTSP